MTVTDWVVTVATALSALAAWVALGFSIYNAYARRKDRTPRVELATGWNLPRDVPQAMKSPSFHATANPGEAIFLCEVTNIGIAGVKIKEVYVYIDAPPGKPIPLHLPQEDQLRKLDNGDSQTWSSRPLNYDRRVGVATWVKVLALDTTGNRYEAKTPPSQAILLALFTELPVSRIPGNSVSEKTSSRQLVNRGAA